MSQAGRRPFGSPVARAALAIAVVVLLCLASSPRDGRARAADAPPVGPIGLQPGGASGGSSQGLTVIGDRIYVGVGEHIEVLTLPAGDAFERAGIVDVGVGVSAVAAGAGALWVGGTDGTLKRYDLADPDRPVRTDDLSLMPTAVDGARDDPSSVIALAVGETVLFAALGDGGLAVVALAAGRAPRLADRIMAGGMVTDVGAIGATGYVADGQRGLVVIDAADADHVVERTVVPFGDLAPAQPMGVVAGPIAVDAQAKQLFVSVCNGLCGFRPGPAMIIAYDVADRFAPAELSRAATDYTNANDLVVTDDHAYLAITQCGPFCWSDIKSFDRTGGGGLTAVPSPAPWGGTHRFVTALGVDAAGVLIAAEQGGGVAALSSTAPFLTASWSYAGDPAAVAFDGDRMLVVDADAKGLRMIDIGGAPGPRPIAAWIPGAADAEWGFDFATGTTAVALDGRRAVMADGLAGVLVFDAAASGPLTLIGRTEQPSASAVALRGTDAFVGMTGFEGEGPAAGVAYVDLSGPDAPVVGAPVAVPRAVASLTLVDDTLWALLCGTSWSVVALDIRTPRAPVVIGAETELEGAERPMIADGRLAVGMHEGRGVDVYDLASTRTPRILARLPDAGHVLGLWGDLVYTARLGTVDVYRVTASGAASSRVATYAVPGYVPTAWNPGWVDRAGRVILNRWGNGWTVLATVPLELRGRALLPWAGRP